jgi:hypothetical protein
VVESFCESFCCHCNSPLTARLSKGSGD